MTGASLRAYASPVLGTLPVRGITTALVTRHRTFRWMTKSETASRVRGRIEAVLDWAKVRGYRDGENPARLKAHLDHLLPYSEEGSQGQASRRVALCRDR